ncbi:Conserved oligomeric Golgi complex subunit 3 domain protein [Saccharomyces cerevisiae]|nr:Conserved oligomeric Golgi complex subunit 3 domain protein [Saccharomyces cerevisiae]
MVDARTELISELRNVIKDFTESTSLELIDDTLDINKNGKFAKDQVADVMYLDVFTDFFAKEVADLLRNGDIDTMTK